MKHLQRGEKTVRVVPAFNHDCRRYGKIVVTIENAGVGLLTLRVPRHKQRFEIPIDAVYLQAVKSHVARLRMEKINARKAKRKSR